VLMTREKRLEDHAKRIAVEEAIDDMVARVRTDATEQELIESIERIKERKAKIRASLSLLKDSEFKQLNSEVLTVIAEIRRVEHERASCFQEMFAIRDRCTVEIERLEKRLKELKQQVACARHDESLRNLAAIDTRLRKRLGEAVDKLEEYADERGISIEETLKRVEDLEKPETKKIVRNLDKAFPKSWPSSWFTVSGPMTWAEWRSRLAGLGCKIVRDRSEKRAFDKVSAKEARALLMKCQIVYTPIVD
jgi:hypothetical protein